MTVTRRIQQVHERIKKMKCGCWQKISVIVLAVATYQGCSCSTMPQLMKQDVESVVFERHQDNGLQLEAKWADLSQDEQTLLSHWMLNSPLEGQVSLVTYVPVVVVRAKRFNLNFTGDIVVCNYEVKPGKWRQITRIINPEDEQVRQCIMRVTTRKEKPEGR